MKNQRTALVTGANRGLGREVCRQLLDQGFRVILTARNADSGAAAARDLGTDFLHLDVSTADSVSEAAVEFARRYESLDLLVNNAGVSIDGFNAAQAAATLETNFFGAVRTTDAFLPFLTGDAAIVMVSSGLGSLDGYGSELRRRFLDPSLDRAGTARLARDFLTSVEGGDYKRKGWPESAYGVSKACMNAETRAMATEFRAAANRRRINSVCPGWVRTDMGGASAPRSLAAGAASIVWACRLDGSGLPNGGFFRDGKAISW